MWNIKNLYFSPVIDPWSAEAFMIVVKTNAFAENFVKLAWMWNFDKVFDKKQKKTCDFLNLLIICKIP